MNIKPFILPGVIIAGALVLRTQTVIETPGNTVSVPTGTPYMNFQTVLIISAVIWGIYIYSK